MSKLLKLEFAAVVLLLIVAVLVRIGLDSAKGTQLEAPVQPPAESGTTESVAPKPSIEQTEPNHPAEPADPVETEVPEEPEELTFAEDFTLASRDYFVYDCSAEHLMVVSPDGVDERVYPASVTKLFTAYVALKYLDPDTVVTLGREVYMIAEDSSCAGLKNGQKISVADLVVGMLLPSGNDAAYGLAVAAAKVHSGDRSMEPADALAYFMELMNAVAQKEGMTGSHFTNPDGYHDRDHYTTCADLITIARLALGNDLIRSCTIRTTDQVRFSSGELAVWNNTNALINPESSYYHADAVGLKTGHTSYAGFCVLSAFERDGEYIIIGAFGCQRPEDRYKDVLKLYNLVLETKSE